MKNPPHPGDLIGTEIVEALGLNVSQAARILKVRRATLSDLLHGKANLTPEMAIRIEKAFGPRKSPILTSPSRTRGARHCPHQPARAILRTKEIERHADSKRKGQRRPGYRL